MKQYPPHRSQAAVGRLAMLVLTLAMSLFFVMSMAAGGPDGAGPLAQPLEAPAGFGQ
jgi:hypothetical protein